MKKLRSYILSLALILGLFILPGRVYADSLNIGVSGGGNFNVGDTFTVTISAGGVGGNYVAEGALTYDPSVLSVAGMGGSIPFVVDNGNISTSVGGASITFTCLKAGNSGIAISGTTAINVDTGDDLAVAAGSTSASVTVPTEAPVSHEANLTSLLTSLGAVDAGAGQWTLNCAYDVTTFAINPGVSAGASWSAGGDFNNLAVGENHFTITVTAQDGVTSRSFPITVIRAPQPETTTQESTTQESTTQESTEEETSESETETGETSDGLIVPTTEGEELYILPDLSEIEIPEGAEVINYTVHGETVQAVELANGLILLYLTDENGENGAFYVYDEESGTAVLYTSVGCSNLHYVLLPMKEELNAPFGYHAGKVTIEGTTVDAFVRDDIEDLYLVYAIDENGNEGLFRYDAQTGSFMRYEADPGQSVTDDGEGIASLQESYIRLADQYNHDMRARKKQMILLVIPALLFLAAAIYCLMKWMHGDDFPPENPFRPRDPEGPSDDDVKEVDRMLDEEIRRADESEAESFSVSGIDQLADEDFELGAAAGLGLAAAVTDEEEEMIPEEEIEVPVQEESAAGMSRSHVNEDGFDEEFVNGLAEVMAEAAAEEAEEAEEIAVIPAAVESESEEVVPAEDPDGFGELFEELLEAPPEPDPEPEVTTDDVFPDAEQSVPVEEISEEEQLSNEMNEALADFFGEPVEEPMEILPAVEAIPVISEGANEHKLHEVGEPVEEESDEEFALGEDMLLSQAGMAFLPEEGDDEDPAAGEELFDDLVPPLTEEDMTAAGSAADDPLSVTEQIFFASSLFTTKVPVEEVAKAQAVSSAAPNGSSSGSEASLSERENSPAGMEASPVRSRRGRQAGPENYGFIVEDLFGEETEIAAAEAEIAAQKNRAITEETQAPKTSAAKTFAPKATEPEYEEIEIGYNTLPGTEALGETEMFGEMEALGETEMFGETEAIAESERSGENGAVPADGSEERMNAAGDDSAPETEEETDEAGFTFSRRAMYGNTVIDGVDIEADIDTYLNAEPEQKITEDAKEAMKAQRNAEPVVQMTVLSTDDFEIIEL